MEIKEINHDGHTFLTVNNGKNLTITFCNYGASVYAIKYKDNYVTYHPESYDEFLNSTKYYGKTLGRVCGRLKNGLMVIDGKTYQLDKNEKGNTLHGGIKNLSFRTFNHEINENDETINVVFKYYSADGECGFPANVRVIVIYAISKDKDKFKIHYHVTPDAVTPLNFSTHIYWRLGGDDVLKHILYIKANRRVIGDDQLINSGIVPADECFDFQNPKHIGKDINKVAKRFPLANGYDHGFVFNDTIGDVVTLKYSHTKLIVKTDMNMVNIYANCYPSGGPLKQYGNDILYGGVAIEPQLYFTSYKDVLCEPKSPFDRFISFELGDC